MADVTDPNGTVCDDSLLDAFGYCNGDAILDCSGVNYYSPSNEDQQNNPNSGNDGLGNICSRNSQNQRFFRCCGSCTDASACDDIYGCVYADCFGNCGGSASYDNCGNCGYGNQYDDCGTWNGCCHSGCDAIGVCGGTCFDSTACGEDQNGCLYADNCGNCGYGNQYDDCGTWNGCCHSGCDAIGVCGGNCNDSSACGEDFNGCLYTNCDGSCTSTIANPNCCPQAFDVRSGLSYVCNGTSYTGTLDPATVPTWGNYTHYAQGDVVLANGQLWYLSSTGGWTVGGAPGAGYGWQQLSTGSKGGINIGALIGLPPFIPV